MSESSSLHDTSINWLNNCRLFGYDSDVKAFEKQIDSASRSKKSRVVAVLLVDAPHVNEAVSSQPVLGKSAENAGAWEPIGIIRTIYYHHVFARTFESYAWIRASHPFDIMEFCQMLFMECCSTSSSQGKGDFVPECCRLLNEHQCLVVIDGLRSKDDWELIEARLMLKTCRSCIVVVTGEESLATRCAPTGAVCSVTRLAKNNAPPPLPCHVQLGLQQRSPTLQKTASLWMENVYFLGRVSEAEKVEEQMTSASGSKTYRVIAVWGASPYVKSVVVRNVFYHCILNKNFDMYAWLDASSHPFSIRDLCQRLLSDRCSTSLDQGDDLVQECRRLLDTNRCFVVIDGMQFNEDWDLITASLSLKTSRSCIVVITGDEGVARQCATHDDGACNIKDVQLEALCSLLEAEGIQDDSKHRRTCISPTLHETASRWLNQFCLLGRDSEVNQLEQRLTLARISNSHRVVSVWGRAGVGKSVLVRTVFYRCVVRNSYDMYAWVHAPQQFDAKNFCQSLLSNLDIRPLKDLREMFDFCQILLRKQCCLVVIDNLKQKENWGSVKAKMSLETSRSCFIVVTRQEEVAIQCATAGDDVCHIKGLEQDAILGLLKGKETGDDGTCLGESEKDVKLFLSKCGGLPTAAYAVRSYLAGKSDAREALKHLNDCDIRRNRLVRRWIAEGYSEGNDGNSMAMFAEKLFDELAGLGILGQRRQVAGDTRMISCQVYSLVLQYIISRETEETILLPLEVSVLEGECSSLKTERVGQHLAIASSWGREKFVFDRLDLSRLRSLTVSGNWESFLISDRMRVLRVIDLEGTSDVKDGDLEQIGELLPRLKFLSLRGCREISKLPDSLGKLRQLQTLDVRGTCVVKLPKTIIKLQRLQYIRAGTLKWNYNGTDGSLSPAEAELATSAPRADEEQPSQEEQMPAPPRSRRRLVHSWFSQLCRRQVDAYGAGIEAPAGIAKLTALHTLGVVDVNTAGGRAILEELKKLTQLRKLGVSGINSRHLPLVSNLESLSLHFQKSDRAVRTDDIQLPMKLRSLNLYGNVENIPASIKDLHNLVKLRLETSTLAKEDVQVLGKLDKLRALRLRVNNVPDAQLQFSGRLDDADHSSPLLFIRLQVLDIAGTNVLHVNFSDGAMGNLELLELRCSPAISGVNHLNSLKQVSLIGSYNDIFKEALEDQLAEHWKKPLLKLETNN